MIVCSCESLSERAVLARIDAGDRSMADLRRSCGAGSDCGSCVHQLRRLLECRRPLREDLAAAK